MRCCAEHDCRRGQPIRVLRSELTGTWYVVTRYTERADGSIVAEQKHSLHPEDAARLNALGKEEV